MLYQYWLLKKATENVQNNLYLQVNQNRNHIREEPVKMNAERQQVLIANDVPTNNDLQMANRGKFEEMLAIEIDRAKTTVSYLSILMIGIDQFKLYHDTYGQISGDDCLKKVAATLNTSLKRTRDLVARWGNEEFTCLLSDTDPTGAADMAEKLRKAIVDLAIPHETSYVDNVVTVSIGVVTSILTDNTSYQRLLKQADEALSQAKKMGGNQICIWKD